MPPPPPPDLLCSGAAVHIGPSCKSDRECAAANISASVKSVTRHGVKSCLPSPQHARQPDKFDVQVDADTQTIRVRRVDLANGWRQDLVLLCRVEVQRAIYVNVTMKIYEKQKNTIMFKGPDGKTHTVTLDMGEVFQMPKDG